jgi:probable rRNA maturation factor
MVTQDIKTKKTLLIFNDTAKSHVPLYDTLQLQTWLKEAMSCIGPFLLDSGKGGLALKKYSVKEIELSLTLCGAYKIKSLNSNFRGKEKATDVLSFPIYDTLRPDSGDWVRPGRIVNLGDIFICREVALRQSKEFNVTLEEEILHLFIHGLLHLCGFDHEISKKEEDIMCEHEDMLVKQISDRLKR